MAFFLFSFDKTLKNACYTGGGHFFLKKLVKANKMLRRVFFRNQKMSIIF